LTDSERQNKVSALADCISEYHPVAFSYRVERKQFDEFCNSTPLPVDKSDPYFYLFYGIISLMIAQQMREHNFETVNFVFDDQGPLGNEVCDWFETFRAMAPPEVSKRLGKKPDFDDEKIAVPLQAADMFAWYQRRTALGSLHQKWHEQVWAHLTQYHTTSELDSRGLWSMAKSLKIISA
jgi:hypothetical protein